MSAPLTAVRLTLDGDAGVFRDITPEHAELVRHVLACHLVATHVSDADRLFTMVMLSSSKRGISSPVIAQHGPAPYATRRLSFACSEVPSESVRVAIEARGPLTIGDSTALAMALRAALSVACGPTPHPQGSP